MDLNNKPVLVAYFSHTGENYAVGDITTGNTRIVADIIAETVGGNLFEIKPAKSYPEGYEACTEVAKKEQEEKARPAIISDIDTDNFDVIFVGYPEWWDEPPMCVLTFLEGHDLKGKTVIPFSTHEGSGLGRSVKVIAESCKGADVLDGFAIEGHLAQNNRDKTRDELQKWLKRIGFAPTFSTTDARPSK